MKSSLIIVLVLLCTNQFVCAQESTLLQKRTFGITISGFNHLKAAGWLLNINDSVIQMSAAPVRFGITRTPEMQVTKFYYQDIMKVKLKRKNGGLRGLVTGIAVGALTGVVAGLVSGDDPKDQWFRTTAVEKAVAGGISLGIVGGGIGTLIGALAKKTFIIGGRREKFDAMHTSILNKSYKNNQ